MQKAGVLEADAGFRSLKLEACGLPALELALELMPA